MELHFVGGPRKGAIIRWDHAPEKMFFPVVEEAKAIYVKDTFPCSLSFGMAVYRIDPDFSSELRAYYHYAEKRGKKA